ncbi:NAD(P)H-dependent oxidoreductase [Terasakiella sp. SH-1]|uniref:NAD(P)H-dependent oxidoreductase n=1 Tax=Terasakiella sp. SH-1 TaxID=2560057 RepID=UPI00107482CB|nr:NAD(P)H-dependent oxidoreductase [Terasakiella sp. SH-1]
MKTILLISGKETSEFARGGYNQGLFDTAKETLGQNYHILSTVIEDGYDVEEEIAKYKQADIVIYQYPVYWFMMPSSLKKYMDEVFAYDSFFTFSDGPYGSGGLMTGKKFMLSTTWNAPETVFNNPEHFDNGQSVDDILFPMRTSHFFCGFEELTHFSSHDIVSNPDFERDQKRFIAHLQDTLLKEAQHAA